MCKRRNRLLIPFLDLSRIHNPLKAEMLEAISVLIDKNELVLGESVETFEMRNKSFSRNSNLFFDFK